MSSRPLHPDAEAYLRELAGLGLPASNGITAVALRERARKICAHFRGRPEEMSHVDEIAAPVPMRRYVPFDARRGHALLWLHGGRMISGDLETHDALCRMVAAACEWTVVAVDYRLGPEHRFPAALEDCAAALEAVAGEFRTVALGGDSAGASLALDAALHTKARPSALVLAYPMIDATMSEASHMEFLKGPGTSSEDIAMGYNEWLPEGCQRMDPRVSPLFADGLENLPPVWLLASEVDPLRDEARQLHTRLERAGVRVEFTEAAGMIHGFLTYPGRFAAARVAAAAIARFLTGCAAAA